MSNLLAVALMVVIVAVNDAPYCEAEIIPVEGSQDIRALFVDADVVALVKVIKVDTVSEIEIGGNWKRQLRKNQEAAVSIKRSYKGASAGEVVVVRFTIEEPSVATLSPSLQAGETALVFLKTAQGGLYAFGDRFWGKFRMGEMEGPAENPSNEPLVRLEHDASALIDQPSQTGDALRILLGYQDLDSITEEHVATLLNSKNLELRANARCHTVSDQESGVLSGCCGSL
jgi:hypothetical protein